MARLDLTGFDELCEAFSRMSNVPDEVVSKSLTEMEKVAASKIKASGEAFGIRDEQSSVHILDKIKMQKPKKTGTGGYAEVTFTGSRERGKTTTRNAEIAFVNEYGKTKQQARPFVGKAIEANADAIANAGAQVLFDWQEKTFER